MFRKKKQSADEHDAGMLFRCSFCNKSQKEVRKLIAGPNVYICDECVRICFPIVNSDVEAQSASVPSSSALHAAGTCRMCSLTTLPAAAVIVPGRGALCLACAKAVVEAAVAKP